MTELIHTFHVNDTHKVEKWHYGSGNTNFRYYPTYFKGGKPHYYADSKLGGQLWFAKHESAVKYITRRH